MLCLWVKNKNVFRWLQQSCLELIVLMMPNHLDKHQVVKYATEISFYKITLKIIQLLLIQKFYVPDQTAKLQLFMTLFNYVSLQFVSVLPSIYSNYIIVPRLHLAQQLHSYHIHSFLKLGVLSLVNNQGNYRLGYLKSALDEVWV